MLIDSEGDKKGIVDTKSALAIAQQNNLDLVWSIFSSSINLSDSFSFPLFHKL